jgi:DNA-binding NarL/FixJ family response regulator
MANSISASVALVEDNSETRERLVALLATSADYRLACAAETLAEILEWLAGQEPAILLVDLMLPDGDGIEAVRYCARRYPRADIVIISMFGEEDRVIRSLEAGATGYLLKDGTEDDLLTHLGHLRAGGSPMSPLIARQLVKRVKPAKGMAPARDGVSLTARELEVLDLIARGFTYREIAALMTVEVSTIQTHVRAIYAKLAVHSKTEAVFEAGRQGLLPARPGR